MRTARLRSLAAFVAAAALTGCGRAEEPAAERSAVAATRGPVPSIDSVADTAAAPAPRAREERELIVVDSATDTGRLRGYPGPNACRYVGPRREARYAAPFDTLAMWNGVPYRCRLREGGPDARVIVGGRSGSAEGLEIFIPASSPRRLQVFGLENDEHAYEGADLVVGEDLNGDGWTDVRVMTYFGSGGAMYEVFRFLPARNRFVQDSVLSGTMNVRAIEGRPCARRHNKTSAWDVDVFEHCWSGGRWVLTRTVERDHFAATGLLVETVSERRAGRMRVVSVDTVPH